MTMKRLNPAFRHTPLGPCRLGEAAEIRHTVWGAREALDGRLEFPWASLMESDLNQSGCKKRLAAHSADQQH